MWRFGLFGVLLLSWFSDETLRAATNVACVGDSITFGYGLSWSETYPFKLLKLLPPGCNVTNCGISGTTLLKKGNAPFWNTTQYTASHVNPDIVVIMLGSNDAKPVNWQYGTNFVTDYQDLIATYTNLPTHPRVIICTPPPVFGSVVFNINAGIVATNIVPAIRRVGTNMGVEVIEVFKVFTGHGEWMSDKVHPNSTGTTVLAGAICSALLGDTLNGTLPRLGITRLNGRVVLDWPPAAAGWVLQSAPALTTSNSWKVVNAFPVNNGIAVFGTNDIAASGSLFRLWRP